MIRAAVGVGGSAFVVGYCSFWKLTVFLLSFCRFSCVRTFEVTIYKIVDHFLCTFLFLSTTVVV